MIPGRSEREQPPTPADVRSVSEAELARRIAGAALDAEAEAELCRRFAPRIRLYGLKHLRDEERARDLVQSVLLAALQSLRRGGVADPERLDRFVLGTARNLALKANHADRRAEPTEAAALDCLAVLPETEKLDAHALWQCVGKLDGRARSVLFLSFGREKQAEEIARALETTAGNVRVVRHRAIAQLRRCLETGGATA
jgi:RNA polymerase sigma-70 factor, ECF subfamily